MASQLRRMLSLPVGGRPDACSPEQKQHAIISSHFLGPKAENMDHLRAIVSEVLDSHGQARRSYFPEDGDFITPAMRDQPAYRSSVEALKQRIRGISEELERNSIPFWSPRLCQASDDDDDVDDDESQPGHRNGWKPFKDLTTWELLNLRPTTILELPIRLTEEYSISPTSLQDALRKFSIQTVGKEYFERDDTFGLKGTGKFFVSSTKHYSWPKGGAITGLGSDNFLDVAVDQDARMNCKDLERKLQNCIDNRIPVFGVVAIIGSTEHGACDPLDKILQVRKRCEAKGLSFSVHCDAAWGGYFRTTLPPQVGGQSLPFVPSLGLREHTIRQLRSLAHADSVTIDPHKSGYINYPAGGLCYRDGRMRYLVTWTSPIVSHSKGESDTSMGLCGVEGSKPGAAAVAAWAAHESIGLNHLGYGRLLGEALFTSTKLYCHWATMTRDGEDLMVVPLNRLPSEIKGLGTRAIESDKNRIRGILSMSNKELHDDETRFRFFAELGGDLMINAFACNFRVDGRPCQDIEEINRLNRRIFQRLSVTKPAKLGNEKGNGAKKTPLWLTTSNFSHAKFGDCLVHFKKRLGLTHERSLNQGNLSFLVNVTMSPWPSDSLLLQEMADCFKTIAEEETKVRVEMRPKR
ncbi:L-tyrosine decarboxylase [Escovopsis weberi]|uniref:L-tyrosine decarboxylase n=1 Tax=Escovopsis weberi TaxID=150374 RepID=A0A0M8MW84_ESCWE|nr:L-tyrosine decarboxylase [Escovopsis weberi]